MDLRFPEDNRLPKWKISLLQGIVAATIAALLVGYWQLQIGQHKFYAELAEENRIRALPIIAPRGRVVDRDGRVLIDNVPAFTVLLERDHPQSLTPAHLTRIAEGLGLNPNKVLRDVRRARSLPRFQPVVLKRGASIDDAAFVASHQLEFPELEIIQTPQRKYPLGEMAAAVLGHVGDVSEEEIARSKSRFLPGDIVGKSGIEGEYDRVLRGRDGLERVVVNSLGEQVGELGAIPARPGRELRLTLDLNLQTVAENALGSNPGAVVALDPRNGQVLAMVSHPSFNPNWFATWITSKEWKQLLTNPENPLMDKAIQAQLAPGSVFKIVVATAALESGTITPEFTVDDTGETAIYGHVFHSWTYWENVPALGDVNLHRAIVFSSDAYFYTVGKMLGIDKIDYYARHLGLGRLTGIDLPGEEPGLIPSPAWVERSFKHPWWPGETISVAIGQGAVMVTPLQLAYALGGIASGGVFHRPHLVFHSELEKLDLDPPAHGTFDFPLHKQTVKAVTSGMWGVVNQGGTGAGARCPGIDIGGKTGTAQVVSEGLAQKDRGQFRDNAWFVGLSPARDPRIVVAVLVVAGRESSVAAPIAGQVIKAYYAEQQGTPGNPVNQQLQAQTAPAPQAKQADPKSDDPPQKPEK